MKYYALFYTAQQPGRLRACKITAGFKSPLLQPTDEDKIQVMVDLVKEQDKTINPDSIQPHFLVEITEEEYNRK